MTHFLVVDFSRELFQNKGELKSPPFTYLDSKNPQHKHENQ